MEEFINNVSKSHVGYISMNGDKNSDGSELEADSTKTTRRGYLKKGAVGAIFPLFADGQQTIRDKTVEIITQRTKNGIEKTREVPAPWKQNVDKTRKVQSSIVKAYSNANGIVSISRTTGDRKFNGKPGQKVSVEIDPEKVKKELPTEQNGVKIETTNAEPRTQISCGGFTDNINPAKGGIACDGDGPGTVTLGIDWTESSADDLLLTCAHLWDYNCSGDMENEDLAQGGNHYGNVIKWDHSADFAIVDGDDGSWTDENSEGKIKDEEGTWPVDAWYTEYGLDNLMSKGETDSVYSMGTTTGQTSGDVTKVGGVDTSAECFTYDGHGVKADMIVGNGDSGGPMYTYNDDNSKAVMVSMSNLAHGDNLDTIGCRGTYRPTFPKGSGTAFYYLNNNWGISPK